MALAKLPYWLAMKIAVNKSRANICIWGGNTLY